MKNRAYNLFLDVVMAGMIAFFCAFLPSSYAQNAGNIYGQDQVLRSGNAEFGVVLQVSIKQAEASSQARTAGAGLGAAVGGLLASGAGSSSWGKNALGVMVGGLVGERIANGTNRAEAQEIIVQTMDNNGQPRIQVIVQPAPFDQVSPGQNVLVTRISGRVRVIPNNIALVGR